MTDEEIMQECKESPEFREFLKTLCSFAHDNVALGAVRILIDELPGGMENAVEHAANYLQDHGRTEAAQRIRNN